MRANAIQRVIFGFAIFGTTRISSAAPYVASAANLDIWAEAGERRVAANPVSFRVRCETHVGWKVHYFNVHNPSLHSDLINVFQVCVVGNCESLGNWDPQRAFALQTDSSSYPTWQV
jgi:hypothetical protein